MCRLQRMCATLLISFFVLGLCMYNASVIESHHVMGDGTAHHVCPLKGTTPGCVGIVEHLSHWQSSFAITFTALVFLLFVSVVYVLLWEIQNRIPIMTRALTERTRHTYLQRRTLSRHYLQEAFSNGLLNPRVHCALSL